MLLNLSHSKIHHLKSQGSIGVVVIYSIKPQGSNYILQVNIILGFDFPWQHC